VSNNAFNVVCPPEERWFLAVAKIAVDFNDQARTETGSGFFVGVEGVQYLVTARHVVDPSYRPPRKQRHGATAIRVKASITTVAEKSTGERGYSFAEFCAQDPQIRCCDDDTDLAVVKFDDKNGLNSTRGNFKHSPFGFAPSMLADSEFLKRIPAGGQCVFVGYPENHPKWSLQSSGTGANVPFPFMRSAILAFPATEGLCIPGFRGRNYGVIDGYAEQGFSGGPLFLQAIGNLGDASNDGIAGPARIIGLVCGHYETSGSSNNHSGMSYFVRSDKLDQLLEGF